MRSPTHIPAPLLLPPLLLALPSLLAPLLLLPRGTAAKVFTLGYITGSRRRPGDLEYPRPGLTISGAASLAVAEVNGEILRSMGHRLELRVAETYGEEAESIRAAARLWRDGVDAYIGPQETCVHEGRMAAAFNLPMVSYFCTHRETSDKKRYPTFARTRPPDTQISKSVVSLLLYFNWTQVAFVHQTSVDSEFSAVAATLLVALEASGVGVRAVKTWPGPFHLGYMNNPFHKIIEDTKENARVYVILGHYYEHIGLLVAMDEMELLDNGDYFVVGVDSSEPYDTSAPAKYFGGPLLDHPHPRAISASRSYLSILPSPSPVLSSSAPPRARPRAMALPRPSTPGSRRRLLPVARGGSAWGSRKNNSVGSAALAPGSGDAVNSIQEAADRFTTLVNTYMELPPFSFRNPLVSLGVAVKIPPEAAYLYDAVHLYARALESVLLSGGDSRNGTAIIEAMRGARYLSAMGYIVSLDGNGDAGGNYTVVGRRLVPSDIGATMEYAMIPVGQFYAPVNLGSEKFEADTHPGSDVQAKFTLPELRMLLSVDWVGGEPPLAEPTCGFAGEKCITYTAEIVASVAGGVALTLAIIGLVLYRNWRYEQALDSLLWKVDFKDIQMYEGEQSAGPTSGTANGNPLIRTSQASLSSNPDAEWRRGVAYTPVGIYRGRPFAVKKLQSYRQRPLAVDRAMKKELKMMRDLRHDNLVCFIGACTEPPNVCILTEYCARGSLRDILENEDLKLDNMFVASLVGDILRGMIFLHDSPIRSHGSLKPSNCLVDSRWVLKIADFGLHAFKREADAQPLKHVYGLVYRAPELLRAAISSLWPGTQRGDAYSFGLIVYELHARQGPFGINALPGFQQSDILKRVMGGSKGEHDSPLRPPLDTLETSFDFVRDCLKECWAECPEDRPDFRSIRLKLRPIRKGMKPNIFDNMMAMMEKYANNLEQLVDERTDQLIVEKRKTDALLYEMLPRCVAEQLKRGHRVEAESYDCVSIYFSDIVGFTAMSAESTPLQVVDFLNDLYTCFDSILENYDVYKVETIGDAYMVVSGLPLRNGEQHAAEIASMSLHLLAAVTKFRIRHRPNDPLQLRIGIHSGPVCAGVVGLKMPRYCLFGDTVNTASRMESNGLPLKIHCSSEFRTLLDRLGGYQLVSRGLVHMKGKGDVQTHWLLGEDSDVEGLSQDGVRRVRPPPQGAEGSEPMPVEDARGAATIAEKAEGPQRQEDAAALTIADARRIPAPTTGETLGDADLTDAGNPGKEGMVPEDALDMDRSRLNIRNHRSLTPPLRGEQPPSVPVRSSMRKQQAGTGEWHGVEADNFAVPAFPSHSSLRKHHHALAGPGLRRGSSRSRRRSLESSPKKLRFASEVVGDGVAVDKVTAGGDGGRKDGEGTEAPEAVAASPGRAERESKATTSPAGSEKQRRVSKAKKRRKKLGDGEGGTKGGGSTGDWRMILSNTVPPWRRRGKSAECLEREDPWAWDLVGRSGVGGLPRLYSHTANKLGLPPSSFPCNERGVPKARSIASMGGGSVHYDGVQEMGNGVRMDPHSPIAVDARGYLCGVDGKLSVAVHAVDRLSVPMIQSGMYSSTSCESNQSQEWSDCGVASNNSAGEDATSDGSGRRACSGMGGEASGGRKDRREEGVGSHGDGGRLPGDFGDGVGGAWLDGEGGSGEEEKLLCGGEGRRVTGMCHSPVHGMEEGRGADWEGLFRPGGGGAALRVDGCEYGEEVSGDEEELVRPLLPSLGGENARI
ncbi:guanylate cyclase 32E [Hetaerina americana]|uniref:guanylate cyclase 32E n=1 Tax=Hetaerina americana TaxID=62018 RepID=UPI003A7F373C